MKKTVFYAAAEKDQRRMNHRRKHMKGNKNHEQVIKPVGIKKQNPRYIRDEEDGTIIDLNRIRSRQDITENE